MNVTQQLHDLGESPRLDNITYGLLTSCAPGRYINRLFVTGLTSNPAIIEHAINEADFYAAALRQKALVADLQRGGTAAFVKSWRELLHHIASKTDLLTKIKQT